MAFWQNIMDLWINLSEQMVISASKYLLATVITLEKPRKYYYSTYTESQFSILFMTKMCWELFRMNMGIPLKIKQLRLQDRVWKRHLIIIRFKDESYSFKFAKATSFKRVKRWFQNSADICNFSCLRSKYNTYTLLCLI